MEPVPIQNHYETVLVCQDSIIKTIENRRID